MKVIRAHFTDHPASVNETYLEHMAMSAGFGRALLVATACAFVHAIFPFLFEKTASGIINQLHSRMVTNRLLKTAKSHDAEMVRKATAGVYYI